jgi:hypothetical protein
VREHPTHCMRGQTSWRPKKARICSSRSMTDQAT